MEQKTALARLVLTLAVSSGPFFAIAQPADCLGISGGSALPGTPCDDLNFYSINDLWDVSCNCAGTPVDCNMDMFGTGWPGTVCDDGNANTIGDFFHYPCNCSGDCQGCDCYGAQGGPYLPGTPCDDLHPATIFDTFQSNCDCMGQKNFIYGQVFLDLDLDGVLDLGEPTIANRTVQITPGNFQGTSGLNGAYFIVAGINTYDITAAPGSFDAQGGVPPQVAFGAIGQSSWGNNIPLWATSMQGDLSVAISSQRARPVFSNTVTVSCKNEGTTPASGTVTFTFDPLQAYIASVPTGTLAGNTLTWSTPMVGIGEIVSFEVLLNTPFGTPLMTPLQHSATVVALPPDAIPANDTYVFNDVVVGSWDPNDKLVSHPLLSPAQVAAGEPLTYTIRFQNTGTWLAEDVRISDSLPPQLDHASIEFIGSSHPQQWSVSNGVLGILFDQIMLPDSGANEPESHGFFQFRITPFSTLQLGDSISNIAAIYFDFNEPVITAPAVTVVEVNTPVSNTLRDQKAIRVWPNPAEHVFTLNYPAQAMAGELEVRDLNGKVVLREPLPAWSTVRRVELSAQAAGMYHCVLRWAGHAASIRQVIEP